MIYAVGIMERKYMKIGYTAESDVDRRISELQTGCPFQIQERFVIDGTLRQEQSLHDALRRAFGRIRIPIPPNEWYPARNTFFTNFLKELEFGFDCGFAFLTQYDPSHKRPSTRPDRQDVLPNFKWPVK